MPNGRKNLLGDTDIARALWVVIVTIKTRARGEILKSRSRLLNTLGWGYERAIQLTIFKRFRQELCPWPPQYY